MYPCESIFITIFCGYYCCCCTIIGYSVIKEECGLENKCKNLKDDCYELYNKCTKKNDYERVRLDVSETSEIPMNTIGNSKETYINFRRDEPVMRMMYPASMNT